MELIRKYFPDTDHRQSRQFEKLLEIVPVLNRQVNVISRKDIDHLEERHLLHSLSIARKFSFPKGSKVVDAGTGGGFPGIPLAILFPEARFILADSIGKKIRLVDEIIRILGLKNAVAIHQRVEKLGTRAEYVVSRAVASFPQLYSWAGKMIIPGTPGPNGLIALKGGDLQDELVQFSGKVELFPISTWFEEPFFSTKTIVYLKK